MRIAGQEHGLLFVKPDGQLPSCIFSSWIFIRVTQGSSKKKRKENSGGTHLLEPSASVSAEEDAPINTPASSPRPPPPDSSSLFSHRSNAECFQSV